MKTLEIFIPVLLLCSQLATLEATPSSNELRFTNSPCTNCERTGFTATSSSGSPRENPETSVEPTSASNGGSISISSPVPSTKEPSMNLTERVRNEILRADIIRLAKLIVENDAIEELALGFTFPADLRDRYLYETTYRFFDPDVIALKGMAKAILMSQQAPKLTEIFIGAVYGLDFDTNLCPKTWKSSKARRSYYYRKSKSQVTTTMTSYSTSSSHTSSVVTVTYKSSNGTTWTYSHKFSSTPHKTTKVTRKTSSSCEHAITTQKHASSGSSEAESRIPECYTSSEIKKIRGGLLDDFSNLQLMNEILYSDPRTEPARRLRKLLVVGTPVNSWLCADCWKPRFCNRNVWWCPAQ
eukprot:g600.t1